MLRRPLLNGADRPTQRLRPHLGCADDVDARFAKHRLRRARTPFVPPLRLGKRGERSSRLPVGPRCCHSAAHPGARVEKNVAVAGGRYLAPVPRISTFYGIVIAMYFDDHPPPHFHARYAEHEAQVSISDGELLQGSLPRRAHALVREWVELHRAELEADWELARQGQPLATIDPLP